MNSTNNNQRRMGVFVFRSKCLLLALSSPKKQPSAFLRILPPFSPMKMKCFVIIDDTSSVSYDERKLNFPTNLQKPKSIPTVVVLLNPPKHMEIRARGCRKTI